MATADGSSLSAVLDEITRSGVDASVLPGNAAKIRLILDLAAELQSTDTRLRVLDVGCGGQYYPFNLWEALVPLKDRVELEGCDLGHLDETARRAADLDFGVTLHEVSALSIVATFAPGAFDAVTSTQVLEHLRDWRAGLRQMRDIVRPGGTLYVTCDSGDHLLSAGARARLLGKRAYARMGSAVPALSRHLRSVISGDWQKAPTRAELATAADELGLVVETLREYCIADVKELQKTAGPRTRMLWLALEEALQDESDPPPDPARYEVLYLRARRAGTPGPPP